MTGQKLPSVGLFSKPLPCLSPAAAQLVPFFPSPLSSKTTGLGIHDSRHGCDYPHISLDWLFAWMMGKKRSQKRQPLAVANRGRATSSTVYPSTLIRDHNPTSWQEMGMESRVQVANPVP